MGRKELVAAIKTLVAPRNNKTFLEVDPERVAYSWYGMLAITAAVQSMRVSVVCKDAWNELDGQGIELQRHWKFTVATTAGVTCVLRIVAYASGSVDRPFSKHRITANVY